MKTAVCAIAKNEFPYILEWVAYQKNIGFDDIYIYDNDSDDGTSELLIQLDKKDIIKRIFWPRIEEVAPQRAAYADFLERFAFNYDWAFVCDLDEFLFIDEGSVKSFIQKAEKIDADVSAIAIPWLIFGANEQENYNNDLVVKRFTACEINCSPSVKTIFKPDSVYQMRTHIVDLHKGKYFDNCFELAQWSNNLPIDLKAPQQGFARVHHYFTKSKQEWIKRKSLAKADRTHIEYANIKLFDKYQKQAKQNFEMLDQTDDINLLMNTINKLIINDLDELKVDVLFNSEAFLILKLENLNIKDSIRLVIDDTYELFSRNYIKLDDSGYALVLNLNKYSVKPKKITVSQTYKRNRVVITSENFPTRNKIMKNVLKYFKNAEYLKMNIFRRMISDEVRYKTCMKTDFGTFIKFPEYQGIIDLQKKDKICQQDIKDFNLKYGKSGEKIFSATLEKNSYFIEKIK